MIVLPKYAIGDKSPMAECAWIVRLRDPFMLALVEPRGLVGIRLHCWPVSVQSERPEGKIFKICKMMAGIWAEDVEQLPGLPSRWDFVFNERFEPPDFLMLDNYHSQWSGVLRIQPPMLVASLNDGGDAIREIHWLDNSPTQEHQVKAIEETTGFLNHYITQEDQLR